MSQMNPGDDANEKPDHTPNWDTFVDQEPDGSDDPIEEDEPVAPAKSGYLDKKVMGLPVTAIAMGIVVIVSGAVVFLLPGLSHKPAPVIGFPATPGAPGQAPGQAPAALTPQISTQVSAQTPVEPVAPRLDVPKVPAPVQIAPPGGANVTPSAALTPPVVGSPTLTSAPVSRPSSSTPVDKASNARLSALESSNAALSRNVVALSDEVRQLQLQLQSLPAASVAHGHKIEPKHEAVRKPAQHPVRTEDARSRPVDGWTVSAITEGRSAIIVDTSGASHVVHEGDAVDGLSIEKIGGSFVATSRGVIR